MTLHSYEVVLDTPLGKRKGTLELTIENGKIEGVLVLFQNQEKVNGEIDESGHCTLRGRFSTLMNKFYYEAEGFIRENSLQLTLCGGKSIFQMEGHALSQRETEASK